MDDDQRDITILAGLIALLAVCGILQSRIARRNEEAIGGLREQVAWLMDRPWVTSETEA